MNDATTAEKPDLAASCRQVAQHEIDHVKAHGWVKLDGFVTPDAAAYLLQRAKEILGEGPDAKIPPKGAGLPYFVPGKVDVFSEEHLGALVRKMGQAAKALMKRGDGVGARHFSSGTLAKLPAAEDARLSGAGKTDFHQDFPEWCVDRTGGMTIWIALEDYGPREGTMHFLDGSHRMGPLGAIQSRKGDVTDVYPGLIEECPLTPQMVYKAGDATVHLDLCVHGASTNLSDKPRFAFGASFVPTDACWNGAPYPIWPEASAALKRYQPLDDKFFPRVAD